MVEEELLCGLLKCVPVGYDSVLHMQDGMSHFPWHSTSSSGINTSVGLCGTKRCTNEQAWSASAGCLGGWLVSPIPNTWILPASQELDARSVASEYSGRKSHATYKHGYAVLQVHA
eukprot:scaffold11037_cov21-Tisochrysis_lutea.AAC.1